MTFDVVIVLWMSCVDDSNTKNQKSHGEKRVLVYKSSREYVVRFLNKHTEWGTKATAAGTAANNKTISILLPIAAAKVSMNRLSCGEFTTLVD